MLSAAPHTPTQPVMPGVLRLHPSLEPLCTAPKESSEAHSRKVICSHVTNAMQVSRQIIREAPGMSSIPLMAGPKFGASSIRQCCYRGAESSAGLTRACYLLQAGTVPPAAALGSLSWTSQLSRLTPQFVSKPVKMFAPGGPCSIWFLSSPWYQGTTVWSCVPVLPRQSLQWKQVEWGVLVLRAYRLVD